jgi:Holliday junction resolvasome RuvABC endonuclease subunit
MMKVEELQMKAEQLADRVGDLLTEEKIEIEVVMSVLVSMLVSTALSQANMTGVELLRLFSQAVEKYEDATNQMEKEIDDEQVISRATH